VARRHARCLIIMPPPALMPAAELLYAISPPPPRCRRHFAAAISFSMSAPEDPFCFSLFFSLTLTRCRHVADRRHADTEQNSNSAMATQ